MKYEKNVRHTLEISNLVKKWYTYFLKTRVLARGAKKIWLHRKHAQMRIVQFGLNHMWKNKVSQHKNVKNKRLKCRCE